MRYLVSDDVNLTRVQDNVKLVLDQVVSKEMLDGIIIKTVYLRSAGANTINHGLGRELQGWQIIRKDANANVWDSQGSNNIPDKTLVLNCSADVIISLWVF